MTQTFNWRAKAASQLQEQDVEKAFFDMAYSQIASKARPLMKDPYKLGFEIVHKSDSNNKLLGIFVFRVNRKLLYAPVFFLNGNIKGTDLLYRHSDKLFTPLTTEWVNYLISQATTSEGFGVNPSERMQATPSNMDLNRIINPPIAEANIRKYASVADVEADKKFTAEEVRKFAMEAFEGMKQAAAELPKSSVLRRFILEDGKHDAVQKIANAATKSASFAKALFYGSDEENYAPADIPVEKSASGVDVEKLAVHFDPINNEQVKSASVADIRRGYHIEDTRKESSLTPIIAPLEREWQSIGGAGVYEVLMADGSFRKCVVAGEDDDMLSRKHPHDMSDEMSRDARHGNRVDRHPTMNVIDVESKASMQTHRNTPLWGKFCCDICKSEDVFVDEPQKGKGYRVFDTRNNKMSRPIFVTKKDKSPAGLTRLTFTYHPKYPGDEGYDPSILLNPDYSGDWDTDNVLGKHYRLVEVGVKPDKEGFVFDENLEFGNRAAMEAVIFENGYKKASVRRLNEDFLMLKLDSADDKWSEPLSKQAATLCLAAHCGMRHDEAAEEVDLAHKEHESAFFYKQALHIRPQDFPQFYQTFNDAYGVLEEPQNLNSFVLASNVDIPLIERHRVGDAVKHEAVNQDSDANPASGATDAMIDTATPEQLYALSQEKGVGQLFEHGLVGSLASTYDAPGMIDKWLPDLEQALDRIGRILFLYYWKPEDFADAYGSDDQVGLENKLVSNFRSFGDLVLDLALKNQRVQEGESGRSGNVAYRL